MTRRVSSWTGLPSPSQDAHDVYWRSDLQRELKALQVAYGHTLAFGKGRSYGDVCYAESGHALGTQSMDRIIRFDPVQGTLVAESGITFSQILSLVLPHGWFLPVTPGTKFVTLGGAIANDVHGKNHHRQGTIGGHIRSFSLVRSDRTQIICSPSQNVDYFAATIGGLGLSGIIEWAEIQLLSIASTQIETTTQRFGSLRDFFSLAEELDAAHEYGVAWIDCHASGTSLGRGIYTAGSHAPHGDLNSKPVWKPGIPFNPRISLLNPLTVKAFNTWTWIHAPSKRSFGNQHFDPFFYPLDGVSNWNRLYGTKGFQQFQCVIPAGTAAEAFTDMLGAIAKSGSASALAVMKRCGDFRSPGLLTFPMPGISLAIDFPQSQGLAERLLPTLDSIVRQSGGRLYPAKDAHMSGADFRSSYPGWKTVETLRDPALNSRFWKRVTT
ncbi:MAG: FAD-binding oxidoreductase [Micropepsaceae bacterium]